ncbi:MAG: sulfotransferase family protein [Candidatus Binataceae bacterium]
MSGESSNDADRLPDFMGVGPPRTATTWLHAALSGHVGLPKGVKETHFFVWEYERGIDWYKEFFRDCAPGLPVGEIDPTCFDRPQARDRIADQIPNCKIIVTLRNPVERVWSHYKTMHRTRVIRGPFNFEKERTRLGATHSYASNLAGWFRVFGRDNVRVLLYDELEADRQAFLDRACEFIGAPRIDLSASPLATRRVNQSVGMPRSLALARIGRRFSEVARERHWTRISKELEAGHRLAYFFFAGGKDYPPIDPAEERRLRTYFLPQIEELVKLCDRVLSAWTAPRALDAMED